MARLEYELAYYDSAVHRFKPLHHEDTPGQHIVEMLACLYVYVYLEA